MEDLFKGVVTEDPSSSQSPLDETPQDKEERERAMKAIWEAMLIEGMSGEIEGNKGDGKGFDFKGTESGQCKVSSKDKEGDKGDGKAGDMDDFQKTVRATMEKLKGSESTLKVLLPYFFCSSSSTPTNCRSVFVSTY
jgi:peroxin-19